MLRNPLRYPGGKSFLAGYIAKIIDINGLAGCAIYEPFAGSAAVSLQLIDKGIVSKAILVERDPMVYAFWKAVTELPEELIAAIEKLDISMDTWNRLQPLRLAVTPLEYPLLDLGLAALFFNRTNYSGILSAGPLGGRRQTSQYRIDCRFNKKDICARIAAIAQHALKIEVRWDDAVAFIKQNLKTLNTTDCFVYLDPPYHNKGAEDLYRFYYSESDHVALAETIRRARYPWLISYDDSKFIKSLYFGQRNDIRMQRLYMDYSAQRHKRGSELLISNLELPPASRFNSVGIEMVTG